METSSKALEDLQELLSRDASLQQRMLQASDMASATRYLLDAACAHGLALSQQDINTALSQAAKEAQAIPTQELEELVAGRKTIAMGVVVLGRLILGRELRRMDAEAEKAAAQGGGGGGDF